MATQAVTPLMQQYREIKARHPGTILFFRMGDFYETFYEDAELIARVLGITLTSRNNGGAAQVPLAGVPVKAGPDYVRRLVQLGHRVSICEQVEDPKTAKGVVRREVVETVTPGAAFSDELLDGSRNNYLCAMAVDMKSSEPRVGIAALDLSTGELRLLVVAHTEMEAMLARLSPREIVVPDDVVTAFDSTLVAQRPAWEFDPAMAREELQRQFGVRSLDGFGVESSDDIAVGAAGRNDAQKSRAHRIASWWRRSGRYAHWSARPHAHSDGSAATTTVDSRATHECRNDRCAPGCGWRVRFGCHDACHNARGSRRCA